jgi:mRNA-degrading endonuclease RelE of RelBE toxin-antitoxin system
MVEVVLTETAQRQMVKLPAAMIRRINDVLLRLQKWPHVSGVRALRGHLAGCYRIRSGDWRVLFRAVGNRVEVFAVDNRRDVYRS